MREALKIGILQILNVLMIGLQKQLEILLFIVPMEQFPKMVLLHIIIKKGDKYFDYRKFTYFENT